MTVEKLISEGEALMRPSWLLASQPTLSGIVGYWGGRRKDMPDELPPQAVAFSGRRHIFTLAETILPDFGRIEGPLSLFEWEHVEGERSYRVETDHRLRFADLSFSGEPLYATEAASFPPFPAVCLYGSDHVGAWLQAQGLARHDYWRVADPLVREYELEWQRRSPYCQQSGDVIVGGWHFLWPEDDFFAPLELRLVALTLRDAEPWFEVWRSPRGWTPKRRAT
jgi:hypothetical protein